MKLTKEEKEYLIKMVGEDKKSNGVILTNEWLIQGGLMPKLRGDLGKRIRIANHILSKLKKE